MKILGWIQNKIYGSNGKKKQNSISATYYILHEPCKQEFSDRPEWPQTILAIGMLGVGNNNLKEDSGRIAGDYSYSSQDCVQEPTPKDAGNLHDELNKIDQIINQHFEEENETFISDGYNNINSGNFHPSSSVINHSLGKGFCLDAIGKKSLVFPLKKIFVCGSGGFQPTHPSFKDPPSRESRMEKILRAMLHRKICPQGQRSAISTNKYLENRSDNGEEELTTDDADNGSKWDKTDSEYIVLEI